MARLELRGVRKRYGALEVIPPLDLDVPDASFVALVGPSGCGKSTLLRMIAGLEDLDGGHVLIDGREVDHVSPKGRNVAMVFQNYALYPHMTVAQNMAFSLRLSGIAKAEREAAVGRAAGILGLDGLLDRYPGQLSGGSASAWPWGARSFAIRPSFSSTSRCRTSMLRFASRCGRKSRRCTPSFARRQST